MCSTHASDAPAFSSTQVSDTLAKAKDPVGEGKLPFALKPKLAVNSLGRAFDRCDLLVPLSGAERSDPADDDPLNPDDDGTPWHQAGTAICKRLNSVGCKGGTVHCDRSHQLHQIPCSNGGREQTWRDDIKSGHHSTCNPEKAKRQKINQIMTKLAPAESDSDCHSPGFDIVTVKTIAAIKLSDATTAASSKEA